MFNFIIHLDHFIHLEFIPVNGMRYGFKFSFFPKDHAFFPQRIEMPPLSYTKFSNGLGSTCQFSVHESVRPEIHEDHLDPPLDKSTVCPCHVLTLSRSAQPHRAKAYEWPLNLSMEWLRSIQSDCDGHHNRLSATQTTPTALLRAPVLTEGVWGMASASGPLGNGCSKVLPGSCWTLRYRIAI